MTDRHGILTARPLASTSTCSGTAFWQEGLQAVAARRVHQGPTDQPEGRSPGPPPAFHQRGEKLADGPRASAPCCLHCPIDMNVPLGLCRASHSSPRVFRLILCAFSSQSDSGPQLHGRDVYS